MKLILGAVLAFNLLTGMAYPKSYMDTEYLEETTALPNENYEENGEKGDMEKCKETMARNGLNFSSFWQGAGHGIHSLSLKEIRHYFEPDDPEENRIPVVNTNLTSEKTILFNDYMIISNSNFNKNDLTEVWQCAISKRLFSTTYCSPNLSIS